MIVLFLIFSQIFILSFNSHSKVYNNNFEGKTWKLDKIIFGKANKDTFLISNKDSVYLISFGKMRRNKKCDVRLDIIFSSKKQIPIFGTLFTIDKKYNLTPKNSLYQIQKLNKNYGIPFSRLLKSFYYSFEDDTMIMRNAINFKDSFGEITLFLTKHSEYIKP